MSNFDAGGRETTVSESSNPLDGRPGGSRSYGDAQTAVRPPAEPATTHASAPTAPPASAPVPTPAPLAQPPASAPGGEPEDSRRPGLAGPADTVGRALSGASRSFARVGAAIGNATQGQGGNQNQQGQQSRPGANPQARVRKARLRVARVDPWSVMKVSFVLSIAMGIVTIVGTAVVWNVLNALGVFSSLNKTVGDLTSGSTGTASSFNLSSFLSFGHVEGYMMVIALVDVVLATALATLGAYLYNLAAGFVGGFEVTLAEDQ
jgi:hypothetical protein